MSPEVTTALIAAIVSIITSSITLVIGIRSIRLERDKLQTDRKRLESELEVEGKKLQADRERLQLALRESDERARIGKAEIAKLKAETDKLAIEADEIRRRRIKVEQDEIRHLLKLFDRAVFDAPLLSEEPISMFIAIQETRVSMQVNGASFLPDREVAEHFQTIREILLKVESDIRVNYPDIVRLAAEYGGDTSSFVLREAKRALGRKYYEPVRLMMDLRSEVQGHIRIITSRLRELDDLLR